MTNCDILNMIDEPDSGLFKLYFLDSTLESMTTQIKTNEDEKQSVKDLISNKYDDSEDSIFCWYPSDILLHDERNIRLKKSPFQETIKLK